MKDSFKKGFIWIVIIGVIVFTWRILNNNQHRNNQIIYSDFLSQVDNGKIASVVIQGSVGNGYEIKAISSLNNQSVKLYAPQDYGLIPKLVQNNVKIDFKPEEREGFLRGLLVSSLPLIIFVCIWIYIMRQMQGGGSGKGGAFSFGRSKARLLDKNKNKTTFIDVAGCDEAKEEVSEIVDYLKDSSRYQTLGGKVPKGVLLIGSPGTGKTLLAKAIAGEAKVPFFSISGSDFVEMFVGVGASRVRDMFDQAKKHAPCIIFIDEIDAVGRQRGAGVGGGHDEKEQTLNQLLVEMDGFNTNNTVIVVAATNRPDVLDPALQRPGRFDRQVIVPLPDIKGREQILNVHIKKIKYDNSVNIKDLARGTPGFSGADLANLVNEAALFAGRRNKSVVDNSDFEDAKDKIYMGPERKSMVMTEEEKKATAYHESGHAVVAEVLPGTDPVHKVTIVPRGRALGVTWQLPEKDKISMYKDQLLNQISILFGGRIAEDLFVKNISTGASNDFEKATQIARDMVMKYGMSEEMGPLVYIDNKDEVFLGRSVTKTQHISETTMNKIDSEIRRIIDEQYAIAKQILIKHSKQVEIMTSALMKWETIDADQISEIMQGKSPSEPKDYSHNVKSEEEIVQDSKIDDQKIDDHQYKSDTIV